MNETLKQSLLGVIRHLLTVGAGALGISGATSENEIQIVSAGLVGIIAIVWSVINKRGQSSAPLVLIPFLVAGLTVTGCQITPDRISYLAEDAYDVGDGGASILLAYSPGSLEDLQRAVAGLEALEDQDSITLSSVVEIVDALKLEELEGGEADAIKSLLRIFLRRIQNAWVGGNLDDLKPIVRALREGIEAALPTEEQ